METIDLLLVGVEVSVAFAGFAGIIATFQFRGESIVKRGDIVGLSMIVQSSLTCAALSVLPLILFIFEIRDAMVWAICSGVGAVSVGNSMYGIDKNMRGAVRRLSLRIFFGALQGLFALVVLAQLLNAADIVFHREPGPYITGIVMGLGLVGYMFGRLLLRPLWSAVRRQEADSLTSAAAG
jgi:hypothetical protein